MRGYDEWKTHNPADDQFGEDEVEDGCTCVNRMRRDKWCPVHGLDPDEERERQRDDCDDR